MIIPDANILIYAYDSTSPHHRPAKRWWEASLSGQEPIGIPWVVLLAFTRLMTHPQVCENPLSTEQVREITSVWLACPHLRLLNPSENAVDRFFDLLNEADTGGNLCTDALIALHAMEHSATIFSNDRDFDRFPGVKRVNPVK